MEDKGEHVGPKKNKYTADEQCVRVMPLNNRKKSRNLRDWSVRRRPKRTGLSGRVAMFFSRSHFMERHKLRLKHAKLQENYTWTKNGNFCLKWLSTDRRGQDEGITMIIYSTVEAQSWFWGLQFSLWSLGIKNECRRLQSYFDPPCKSVWLATALFFNMAVIPKTCQCSKSVTG